MSEDTQSFSPAAQALIERFQTRQARVGVVGLGYVGLPLAVALAEAGLEVVGVDLDPAKVKTLNQGKSHLEDVAEARLAPLVASGRFTASVSYEALEGVDGVSISVPTPLRKTGDPDISYIVAATQSLRPYLHPGMVVILESTTYPGTTREVVLPELEVAGLEVGKDLFLAFSPERVDPGRKDWTTETTPKVIGGITPTCTKVAAAFYGLAIQHLVPVSSTETAEMTKLLENTFRAVNIGMANELALMCERLGLDVWEVIEAAATKPFGFMKFTPGPGLGGHCIPIDPLYLSWKLKSVKYTARFIELASEINTNMPRYVVGRIQDALNERGQSLKGSKVLVLGVAFKPDVADTRKSPALDVIGMLMDKGAEVSFHDPYVDSLSEEDWTLNSVEDPVAAAGGVDLVVVVTNHHALDYQAIKAAAPLVFDSRNAYDLAGRSDPKVVKL